MNRPQILIILLITFKLIQAEVILIETKFNNYLDYITTNEEISLKSLTNTIGISGYYKELSYTFFTDIKATDYSLSFSNIDEDEFFSDGDFDLNYSELEFQPGFKLQLDKSYLKVQYKDDLYFDIQFKQPIFPYISFGFKLINESLFENRSLLLENTWEFPLCSNYFYFSPLMSIDSFIGNFTFLYSFNDFELFKSIDDSGLIGKSNYDITFDYNFDLNNMAFNVGFRTIDYTLGLNNNVSYLFIDQAYFQYWDSKNANFNNIYGSIKLQKKFYLGFNFINIKIDEGESITTSEPLSEALIWKKLFLTHSDLNIYLLSIDSLYKLGPVTFGLNYYKINLSPSEISYYIQSSSLGFMGFPTSTTTNAEYKTMDYNYDLLNIKLEYSYEHIKDLKITGGISQLIPLEFDFSSTKTSSLGTKKTIYGGLSINLQFEYSIE